MANTPGGVKKKAEEVVAGATEKARDVASSVTDKAKDVASSVTHKAGDLGGAAGEKADAAAASLGGTMQSLAGTIREKVPQEGLLGSAAGTVAGGLESGGRYLQEEGLSGMVDDLTELIRRNPIPALLVGIGLGFLLARMTRS
jgi:hypothetical protein